MCGHDFPLSLHEAGPLHQFFSHHRLHTLWQHTELINCIARARFVVCNTQARSNCSPPDAGIQKRWRSVCWPHRSSRVDHDQVTSTPQQSRVHRRLTVSILGGEVWSDAVRIGPTPFVMRPCRPPPSPPTVSAAPTPSQTVIRACVCRIPPGTRLQWPNADAARGTK